MVNIGQKVVLPDDLQDTGLADLRLAIGNRHIEAEIVDKTKLGVCQLILQEGESIPGYSKPITEGEYAGCELLDLQEMHIK